MYVINDSATRTLQITSPADEINEQYIITFAGSFFSSLPQAVVSKISIT